MAVAIDEAEASGRQGALQGLPGVGDEAYAE